MPDERKRSFGLLKILGAAVVLLLGVMIAIPFLIDVNQFRPKLESEFTGALGREVKIGNLQLSLFSGSVAADDIAIADDPAFSKAPFVRARSVRVGVEIRPLIFSRAVHITGITLAQPEITLIRSVAGDWNFSSIGGKSNTKKTDNPGASSAGEISVGQLRVTEGKVTVMRGGGRAKPRVYDKVEIKASNLAFHSVFPFSLTAALPGGGSVKLEGKAGPLDAADASLTPFSATLALMHLDVIASGFIEPDSGLAGVIDFDGSLTSDGKQSQSKGRGRAEKLQIVKGGSPTNQPILVDYALNYHLKNQSGTLSDTKVEFGKAVAHLTGNYDLRNEATVLKMKLHGENMPAEDLETLLPAIGVTLPKGASLQGGTLNADLNAEGPVEKVVTTGTIGLFNTRLTGFDLGAKMAAVASLAGIKPNATTEIEKFTSGVRIAPDGIQASSLLLIVPSLGQLTGDGTVGSNSSLDFKMLANLQSSGGVVGNLARITGSSADSSLKIPFSIRGTTSNPSFVPDTKGTAKSLLQSVVSGKGTKADDTGDKLGDTLRGLLGKKKK